MNSATSRAPALKASLVNQKKSGGGVAPGSNKRYERGMAQTDDSWTSRPLARRILAWRALSLPLREHSRNESRCAGELAARRTRCG
ncbi:hypothetical protein GRAN_3907 [Granulicella sibirica]|uniref:Uncharacterized protein n=1 Tax=Granulicella sibirica TaxID=2479048 RepID=A0A4Q0SUS4_9BACT|nr:hypothetical protein GRAN_3907 [Granulicella sibirica]